MESLLFSNIINYQQNNFFIPKFEKKIANFNFSSQYFNFFNNSLIFIFGDNNSGKTLFFELLSAQVIPDNIIRNDQKNFLNYKICYKKENISPKYTNTVDELINNKFDKNILKSELFLKYYNKLEIDKILNIKTNSLFGDTLQKLLIFFQLSNINYDIYLIDLPNNIEKKVKEEIINFSYEFSKIYKKIVLIKENELELLTKYPNEYVIFFEKITKNRALTHNIQNIELFLRNF
jgi:translation initiation factor RLI1